jgi:hypothetical protein
MSLNSRTISKGNNTINEGVIISSTIRNSSLDMNSARITSVGDPQNLPDAANKNYVDALGIRFFNVELTGIAETTFNSFFTGSYTLEIFSNVSNGPTAIFSLSKCRATDGASIIRLCSCAGSVSNERLLVNWPANQGMSLYKTGVNYNGTYTVKLI